MSDRPTPWTVLGVAEGADLETCAAAFRTRLAAAATKLIGAHAEDRPVTSPPGPSWSRPGAR